MEATPASVVAHHNDLEAARHGDAAAAYSTYAAD
jgi:hypothetical protein